MTIRTTLAPVIAVLLVSGHTVTLPGSEHNHLQQAFAMRLSGTDLVTFARYGGGRMRRALARIVRAPSRLHIAAAPTTSRVSCGPFAMWRTGRVASRAP